jgi:hypothetical protein
MRIDERRWSGIGHNFDRRVHRRAQLKKAIPKEK